MATNTTDHVTQPETSRHLSPFGAINHLIVRISVAFGGQRAKEVERFIKFAVVGIIGAFVDFGVMNLLQATVLRPVDPNQSLKVAVATGTAFTAAVVSNFIWNRYWTYPDSRSRSLRQQLAQFFIVNTIGLLFRLWFVSSLFQWFGDAGVEVLHAVGAAKDFSVAQVSQLGTNIAQFFAVWIVMFWNFFVNRYWTYNDVE